MFFILSKITGFMLQPLSWVFALIIFGILYKKGKLKLRFFTIAILVLTFFTNDFIADEFIRLWEMPATPDKEIGHHKTAVILGGMSAWDPYFDRIQFFGSSDRLWQGILLQRTGKVDQLLVTGGSGKISAPEEKEAKFIRYYLKETGIDSTHIYYETESRNTHENAIYTKNLLEKLGDKDTVLLITSGFHMKRAMACFNSAGVPYHIYSTDRMVGGRKFDIDHLIIPSTGALGKWNLILREWVGMITYKIKGYA